MEPRGIRNNNPGNIDFAGQPGAVKETGVKSPRFAKFKTMDDGVYALCHQLGLYFSRHVNTVSQIISKWAPPTENFTAAYVAYVAHSMAVKPTTVLGGTPSDVSHLALAITHLENGQQPFVFNHIMPIAQRALEDVKNGK